METLCVRLLFGLQRLGKMLQAPLPGRLAEEVPRLRLLRVRLLLRLLRQLNQPQLMGILFQAQLPGRLVVGASRLRLLLRKRLWLRLLRRLLR